MACGERSRRMADVSTTTTAESTERFGGELRRFGVVDGGQPFKVVSPYEPSGDQPQAIAKLSQGIRDGLRAHWSPEQIAGRLRADFPDNKGMHVCAETVYQAWIGYNVLDSPMRDE